MYPSENFTIHSYNADARYNVQQPITERGLCATINAPLSKFLTKRYLLIMQEYIAIYLSIEHFLSRQVNVRQEDIDEPMTCDFQQIEQCYVRVVIYSVATVSCPAAFSKVEHYLFLSHYSRLNYIRPKTCRSLMHL